MGSEQLESSEQSDYQQQGSRNCWGTISLGTVGLKVLVQLPVASTETGRKTGLVEDVATRGLELLFD
jgi:hypothetical protein